MWKSLTERTVEQPPGTAEQRAASHLPERTKTHTAARELAPRQPVIKKKKKKLIYHADTEHAAVINIHPQREDSLVALSHPASGDVNDSIT